jgi:hypothetical protein
MLRPKWECWRHAKSNPNGKPNHKILRRRKPAIGIRLSAIGLLQRQQQGEDKAFRVSSFKLEEKPHSALSNQQSAVS